MTALDTTNQSPSSSGAIGGTNEEAEARCSAALSALYQELSRLLSSAGSPAELPAGVAESVGAAFAKGAGAPALARAVLSLGETLDSWAGTGGRDTRQVQQAALDQALVQALQGYETARRQRRQAWLSYLTHELKNPLNTVLNALWLLREKGEDKKQARRFLELAERGARRMETLVCEVRELDEKMQHAPPTSPGADSK